MKIVITKGDKIIHSSIGSEEVITRRRDPGSGYNKEFTIKTVIDLGSHKIIHQEQQPVYVSNNFKPKSIVGDLNVEIDTGREKVPTPKAEPVAKQIEVVDTTPSEEVAKEENIPMDNDPLMYEVVEVPTDDEPEEEEEESVFVDASTEDDDPTMYEVVDTSVTDYQDPIPSDEDDDPPMYEVIDTSENDEEDNKYSQYEDLASNFASKVKIKKSHYRPNGRNDDYYKPTGPSTGSKFIPKDSKHNYR